MEEQWQAAEKVQKNDAGEYRALIGGEWVPASKAQESESGEYRVTLSNKPAQLEQPHPRDISKIDLELTIPEKIASFADRFIDPVRKQAMVDKAAGASGLMRGGANLIQEGLGQKIWPTSGANKGGFDRFTGEVLDPVAWTIGGGVMKVLPYKKVLGDGVVQAHKAVASNVAAGTTIGTAIGTLSEDGTAIEGGIMGAGLAIGMPVAFGAFRKSVGWLYDLATGNAAKVKGGKILQDVLGDSAEATKAAWRNSPEGLSAAQAAGTKGSYQLAALDEVSTKYRPDARDAQTIAQFKANEGMMAGMAGGNTQLKAIQAQQRAGVALNEAQNPLRVGVLDAANIHGQQKPLLQAALADTNKTIGHAWQQIRETMTEGAKQASRGAATGVKLPQSPTGLPAGEAARQSQNLSYAARMNQDKPLPFIQGVKRDGHYKAAQGEFDAAGEFATAMTAAKSSRVLLEKQIGAMPDPISVETLRAAIGRAANARGDASNPIVQSTLRGFDDFVQALAGIVPINFSASFGFSIAL